MYYIYPEDASYDAGFIPVHAVSWIDHNIWMFITIKHTINDAERYAD